MRAKVYVTTIKHDPDTDPEVILTTQPFTKEQLGHIAQNIEVYKEKHPHWDDITDLMDYAVFKPFSKILVIAGGYAEINTED